MSDDRKNDDVPNPFFDQFIKTSRSKGEPGEETKMYREAEEVMKLVAQGVAPPEGWEHIKTSYATCSLHYGTEWNFHYILQDGKWHEEGDISQANRAKAMRRDGADAAAAMALRPNIVIQNGPPVGGPMLKNVWLVKGLIPEQGQVVLYGQPGAGKSFVTLNIAMHIAAGMPWNGKLVKPGIVLYVAMEGALAFQNRIYTCANGMGIDVPQTFAYLTLSLDLGDIGIRRQVEREIQRLQRELGQPVQLVVVDTLWRAFPGINENSAEDMGKVVQDITKLAYSNDAAWLAVHHEGRSTGHARGSTALLGAVDTELKVFAEEYKEDGTFSRVIKCTKSRDGVGGQEWLFELKGVVMGQDEDGDDVQSAYVEFGTVAGKSKTAKRKKPSGAGENILEAIRQMTGEPGADKNPGGVGFPEIGKYIVIRKSELIDHAARQMADDNPKDARKKATSALQTLINNKWVKVNNDLLWLLP